MYREERIEATKAVFTDALWKEIAGKVAGAFKMDERAKEKLAGNKVAKLVAGLPFIAGCDEAYRTALTHLSTFVLANTEECRYDFDHKPADNRDPVARLAPIGDFHGGDKSVIDAGMRRLALCMVAGYKRDAEKDKASGEYNPLNDKAWDYDAIAAQVQKPAGGLNLMARATGPATNAVDSVLGTDEALRGFWQE